MLATPVILLLIVAIFWKRARFILFVLAIMISSVETYYVLYKQDLLIQEWYEHEAIVSDYLKKTYPEDDWLSRQAIRSGFSSADVEVIFIDELEATYFYRVEDGSVNLDGYSLQDGYETPKRK